MYFKDWTHLLILLRIPYLDGSHSSDTGHSARSGIQRHGVIRIIIIRVIVRIHVFVALAVLSSDQSQVEAAAVLRLQIEAGATAAEFTVRDDRDAVSQNVSFVHVMCRQNNGSLC